MAYNTTKQPDQYVMELPAKIGGILKLHLVPEGIWLQATTKVCFTQTQVTTAPKMPDTPMEVKLSKTQPGYATLIKGGRTGAELLAYRQGLAKKEALKLAALEYVKQVAETNKATIETLAKYGFKF